MVWLAELALGEVSLYPWPDCCGGGRNGILPPSGLVWGGGWPVAIYGTFWGCC